MAVTITLSTANSISAQSIKLLKATTLPYYPSASGAEWYGGRLYVMGDDAPNLLLLSKKYNKPDSILVFPRQEKRIHYTVKPDIEAAVMVRQNGQNYLLLTPSFSAPHRNKMVVVPLNGTNKAQVLTSAAPPANGLGEVNIEGAAFVAETLVFSNRGNFTHPQNHLLLAGFDTAKGIVAWQPPMPFILPKTKNFTGVSGLCYVEEKDLLLFTASTEMTASANADGAIGDSYIGLVKSFKEQLQTGKITADTMLLLTPVLRSTIPQKIESVTVERSKKSRLTIHLVADNDNGESSLFRLRLKLHH